MTGGETSEQRARRAVAVVLVCWLVAGATFPAVVAGQGTTAPGEDDDPTTVVRVENATVPTGERGTVDVVLERAPEGLAGYRISVAVANGTVARVRGGGPAALTNPLPADRVGDNLVTFRALDLTDDVTPGARDVTIARITVVGERPGTTTVAARFRSMDADGGARLSPTVTNGTLTVVPGDGTGPGIRWSIWTVALVVLAIGGLGALVVRFRR